MELPGILGARGRSPIGRAGSADLDKRIKEVGFKAIGPNQPGIVTTAATGRAINRKGVRPALGDVVVGVILAITLASCGVAIQNTMNQNNERMRTLQAGMTEEQVIQVMGPSPDKNTPNPYRSEMYSAGGTRFKVLYSYTNRQ